MYVILYDIISAELLEPEEDLTGVVVEEDEAQNELHTALTKARKLNQRKAKPSVFQVRLELYIYREWMWSSGLGRWT